MKLQQLITESTYTENAIFCKKFVLAQLQFGPNKWNAIGGYNYRTIGNSNTLSQHAYGNAWDWHGSASIMKDLTKFFIKFGKQLNIQNIIYNHKIYMAPSYTEQPYGGKNKHEDHVHVDFKIGTKPIYDVNINNRLEKIFDHFYNILVKNPAKYFGKYSSIINDNESGAANFLANEFNLYVDRFNFWFRIVDDNNKKNMKTITKLINFIVQDIKDGNPGKYKVIFYKNIGAGYQPKEYIFNWNYL